MNILEKLNLDDDQFINQQTITDLLSPLSKADLLKEAEELKLGEFSLDSNDDAQVELSFSTEAEASVQLFNSDEDDDPDDLLASADKEGIIPFDENEPVTKYKFLLKAEGAAGASLGDLNIGLEGSAKLVAMAYMRHNLTDSLGTAILSDIRDFPSALSLEEVSGISNGNTIALETEAKIGGSLSFEFSDVFTAGLSGLTQLLESDKLISLDVSKGIKISANYSLQDTYQLVIVKDDTGDYDFLVSVNKSKSSKLSASAKASIGIGFSEPEVFSKALNNQLDKLVSQLVEVSDELYEKAKNWLESEQDSAQLSPELANAIDKLVAHFGIDDIPEKYQELKDKLDEFNEKVKEAVTKEAKNKLKVSIGFEYSRISTYTTLMKARLRAEVLADKATNGKSILSNLVILNPQPLIEKARNAGPDELKVEDFLKKHMAKETFKWAISIGFGKFKFGGADQTSKEFNIHENIDGDQKVSFNGVTGYEEIGKLSGFSDHWSVGFNPAMDDFAQGRDPQPKDFENSFTLRMQHKDRKFRGNNAERGRVKGIVDTALCWGIIEQESFESTFDSIWNTLQNGKDRAPVELTLNLNFTPKAFELASDQWWQLMSQPDLSLQFLAKSMARALTYNKDYDVRSTPDKREATYAGLWLGYLNGTLPSDPRSLAIQVENHIRPMNNVLAQKERDMNSGSLASVVKMNPATKSRWTAFNEGLFDYLDDYRLNEFKDYRSDIRQAYKGIKSISTQSFDVRILGTYLHMLGTLDAEVPSQIDGNLKVDYSDNAGKKKSLVIKKIKS